MNDWEIELISSSSKLNITNKLAQYINKNNVLKIEKNFRYEKLIRNKNKFKNNYFVRIKKNNDRLWPPVTISKDSSFSLNIGEVNSKTRNIEIVYFINTDISNCYLKLLKDQLCDLIKSKILNNKNSKLHCVIICSSEEKKIKIRKLFKKLKIETYCETNLKFSKNNFKEYEGINKVWEIGQNKKLNSYIFYIHGKGLSYLNNRFFYIRQPLERYLFKILIYDWEKNINLIERFESINKIGALAGKFGWLWFNFWLVKSSYVSKLEKPVQRNRACYYEDWLGRFELKNKDNILKEYKNIYGDCYLNTIDQTFNILNKPKKLKYNIGSFCEVKKGGFILGFMKVKYKLWYLFLVILNRVNLNKGDKKRFIFY